MKENICIVILSLILLILAGRLYHMNQEKLNGGDREVGAVVGKNADVDEKNDAVSDIEELPEYSKLYPSLYAENEKSANPYGDLLIADMEKRNNFANYSTSASDKTAYLTFDDGPSHNTRKVLEILEEKNVKATFFVIGNEITEKREDILKLIVEKGHKIGIHTNSHKFTEIYCSVEKYLEDFYLVYEKIYEVTGQRVSIFRFPGGSKNSFCNGLEKKIVPEMARRGFEYYDWNVDAKDSVGRPSEYSIQKNIMKSLTRYQDPVILMHDSAINSLTVSALPSIIDSIRDNGYEFGLVEERDPCHFR